MLSNLTHANGHQADLRTEVERQRLVRKVRAAVTASGRGHLAHAGPAMLASPRRARH